MAQIYVKIFTGVRVAIAAQHIWSERGNLDVVWRLLRQEDSLHLMGSMQNVY